MQPTSVTTCKNTHFKHTGTGMCWVCITWGKFSPIHEGGELGQLLTKAKISQNTISSCLE